MDRSFPASCLQSADTQGTVATAACSSAILSHTHPPRSIHIDTAELDRRLHSIHKSNHSLPPPQLKRGRSGQPLAVQSLQPAPPHEGLMRDRVLSDVRLLVEHLLLQPRDQHRSSSVAFANLRTQQRQPFA